MCDDDDNTVAGTSDSSGSGPFDTSGPSGSSGSASSGSSGPSGAGVGVGSGSSVAIARAARAALAGWEAANRVAGQRLVAAHELMIECVAHPDCWPDPDRPGFAVVDA